MLIFRSLRAHCRRAAGHRIIVFVFCTDLFSVDFIKLLRNIQYHWVDNFYFLCYYQYENQKLPNLTWPVLLWCGAINIWNTKGNNSVIQSIQKILIFFSIKRKSKLILLWQLTYLKQFLNSVSPPDNKCFVIVGDRGANKIVHLEVLNNWRNRSSK